MILLTESSEVKYLCISFWLHNQSDRGWYQILTEVQIIEYRQKKLSFFLTPQGLYFFTQIFFLQTNLILAVHTTAFMQDFPQRFTIFQRHFWKLDTERSLQTWDVSIIQTSLQTNVPMNAVSGLSCAADVTIHIVFEFVKPPLLLEGHQDGKRW